MAEQSESAATKAVFGTNPSSGSRPIAERIAAYLAEGTPKRADVQRAADILVLIQEPDAAMAAAGDAAVWRRMIDAALVARWEAAGAMTGHIDTDPAGDER
jgi:hypothetical protein